MRTLVRAIVIVIALGLYATAAADDPLVEATVLNEQGNGLCQEGRYGEAKKLFEQGLAIREKALGPDHIEVAQSLNNLAVVSRSTGRYGDAEAYAKRALAIAEKALDPGDPTVAYVLDSLVLIYLDQGRYPDAEPLALRSVDVRQRALGSDDALLALSLNNLGSVYLYQGAYSKAEQQLRRALKIREGALDRGDPDVAQSLVNLAALYHEVGRDGEAEPLLRRALAIVETKLGLEHRIVAVIANNLADVYRMSGRYADAEPLLKRAITIREKALGPDHREVAISVNNLAGLYLKQRKYPEAEAELKRARAIWEKAFGPEHPDVAEALSNLGDFYLAQGRYDEAELVLRQSLAIKEKALGSEYLSVAATLNNLGLLAQLRSRDKEAEEAYRRAMAIREKLQLPDNPESISTLTNLAALYEAQGRVEPSLVLSRRAVDVVAQERSLGMIHLYADPARTAKQYLGLLAQHVRIAERAGEVAADRRDASQRETFEVAQLAQGSRAGAAIAAMSARFAARDDTRGAIVREQQDKTARREKINAALVQAAGRSPAERDPTAEATLRSELGETEQRLAALDKTIEAQFSGLADLTNPQPLDVAGVQALLAASEAVLVYLIGSEESWLWVVRRNDIALYRLAIGEKALAGEVQALRSRLDPSDNPGRITFDIARSYALYQQILAPASSRLVEVRHLIVVPDGALQSLPFAVLVTQPPASDGNAVDYRKVSWLARSAAVSVLPSVASLRALRGVASATTATKPLLAIGNPVLDGPARAPAVAAAAGFRGAQIDVDAARRLSPLPDSADELKGLAEVLGAGPEDLLLGGQAQKSRLQVLDLTRYRVIAFATHGLIAGELGLAEPALVLSPPEHPSADDNSLLTASEIALLKLDADWVILSACNTAADDGTPGADGLSGLARAFFYAGSRALLVSHWVVSSPAAVRLTTGTIAALAAEPGMGRAEALRRAEMALLDDTGLGEEFAHPQMWAPFVVGGEGGAAR